MDLETASLDDLAQVVRSEADAAGRVVNLDGAELRSGWESLVLATSRWIYRFPRPHVDFEREVALLRRLHGRLPVCTPKPEWTGARTPFMAYRRLIGTSFDRAAYDAAPPAVRDALAGSLARFLAAMHAALSAGDVAELGIPGDSADPDLTAEGGWGELDRIQAGIQGVGGVVAEYIPDLLEQVRRQRARPREAERVVLHDDFNASNLALTDPVGELVAVWDFSCVRVGDPAIELRYLVGESLDLFERVRAAYEDLTGRVLDGRTSVLAHRLEAVSDAIELDELDGLARQIRRWQTEGVG